MPRRLRFARRLGVLLMPLALAAGLLPGQAARAAQADLLRLAQSAPAGDVGGFSRDQLQAYAAAVRRVQEIDRAWSPKIEQAADEMEAKTLTTQATSEMVDGIKGEGLSVKEYNAITQAAQQDRQLYDRIMTLLAQAR